MIAEVAHALLWLAAACAVLQAAAGLVPRLRVGELAVPAAVAQGWLWLWIAGGLGWVFAATDLSVAGVAATTHSTLPLPLKLTAIAVQPGGGWLVAAALLAWGGAALALAAGRRPRVIGAAGLVAAAATAWLLLGVQPFARLAPAPTEGTGFPVAARAALAGLAPPGATRLDTALPVGGSAGGVTLAAVTPVGGADATGVLAEIRVGGAVLIPEWRETIRPVAGFAVAASAITRDGWLSARFGPQRPDGRWRVTVTRLAWGWPVAILVAVAGLVTAAWRRRR